MTKKRSKEDYSAAELRRLLLDRHRSTRQRRLDRFYQTGRAIRLIPDNDAPSLLDFHSETLSDENQENQEERPRRRNKFFGRMFAVIEIGLVLALGYVIISTISIFRNSNREFVQALEQPTLAPTPLVRAIVLPSGHTPPTSPGGSQPNDAEIPAHLRPLVQSYNNIPIPTPAPEHASRIQIPAINIDAPVIQGTGWEQLKKGVGQVIGTANPGRNGNIVLSAHNDVFGELFRDLDQLQPGDIFTVYTNLRSYQYVVTGWDVVEPTRVEVMDPTPNATATLISCYPYLVDNMRIIVKAELLGI